MLTLAARTMSRNAAIGMLALASLGSFVVPTSSFAAGLDGINYLIAVTQMKSNNANNNAMDGATKQRPQPNNQRAGAPVSMHTGKH